MFYIVQYVYIGTRSYNTAINLVWPNLPRSFGALVHCIRTSRDQGHFSCLLRHVREYLVCAKPTGILKDMLSACRHLLINFKLICGIERTVDFSNGLGKRVPLF